MGLCARVGQENWGLGRSDNKRGEANGKANQQTCSVETKRSDRKRRATVGLYAICFETGQDTKRAELPELVPATAPGDKEPHGQSPAGLLFRIVDAVDSDSISPNTISGLAIWTRALRRFHHCSHADTHTHFRCRADAHAHPSAAFALCARACVSRCSCCHVSTCCACLVLSGL